VIKIRYSTELRPGLNGQAERSGRGTVVHLLPGLTSGQRSATLRRLSQQGRVGIGPRLPATQLAFALLADRLSTALARVGAVVRIHPAGSTLPVLVLSAAALTFLFLSPVSIRIVHQPQAAGGGSAFGAAPAAGDQPSSTAGGRATSAPAKHPAAGSGMGSPEAGRPGSGASPAPATDPSPAASPGPSPVTGSSPTSGPGGTTLTGTAATTSPTPPSATQPPLPSSAPTVGLPVPSATPAPTPSAAATKQASQSCLYVGSLDICLSL
jgi:hypothetical protein